MKTIHLSTWLPAILAAALLMLLGACGGGGDDATTTTPGGGSTSAPQLNMNFPTSLTGAEVAPAALTGALTASLSGFRTLHGEPHCFYEGAGNNDPFQNGYLMTRFLVGAVAQWMCITDFLMTGLTGLGIPTDGSIISIPPDPDDPGAPTGISITMDSATQTTIRFFYGGDIVTAGAYLSWNTNGGTTQGILILTETVMNDPGSPDPNAPNAMRLDFDIGASSQTADMFIAYPAGNPFGVSGFRIQVTKNLDPTAFPIFTALGRMDMNAQFDPNYVDGISGPVFPTLLMYTISDVNGNGAAIASFTNVGFSLDLTNCCLFGHLGHYLFTKVDKYFFDSVLQPVWINKNVTDAIFQDTAARTTSAPNLDFIEGALGLSSTYFDPGDVCGDDGDNCQAMLNAIFAGGDFGAEANFGSDPGDSRSPIIAGVAANGTADYLQSVCPGDVPAPCPAGTFDQTFTPTN